MSIVENSVHLFRHAAAYNVSASASGWSQLMPAGTLSKNVLFVDDEPSIRATLPVILRRYGYTVTTASKVQEALKAIHNHRFDILISDLNIEHSGDGYAVVEAIREVDPRCIVIVLTGYPGIESAVQGIHHGIDDYVIKPSGVDALVAVLAQKLAARRPQARILSVSYDGPLLRTRHMLLEREGYEVVSTSDFASSLEQCRQSSFDIFILGHSIPLEDKQKMVGAFREVCHAPIISLRRSIGETPIEGVNFHIDPDPEPLMNAIAQLARAKNSPSRTGG
jgi:DNA-binding NtrC family response regulator